MDIEKDQYFSKHQDIRYYQSMIRKQDALVNKILSNLRDIRFVDPENLQKLLIQSMQIEVWRQLTLVKYSIRNFKSKANQLQKRFPEKINKLTFDFLQEIQINPVFCPDQSKYIYEEDKERYVDSISIPDELMCRFFKGSS